MTRADETATEIEEHRLHEAYARRTAQAFDRWSNPAYVFLMQDRERRVLAMLRRNGFGDLGRARIFEVGCGRGEWLRQLVKWGAEPKNLVGLDILPDRIAHARDTCPSGITLLCRNAADTKLASSAFDLVIQATVFSSVLDPNLRSSIAKEMLRLLRADGIILWYDLMVNNPRNPDVRRVGKSEIQKLFPGCSIDLHRVTLAPPLCRAVVRRSWWLGALLAAVPFLRTHYLGVIRRVEAAPSGPATG